MSGKFDLLFANDRSGEYPPSWYAASLNPPAAKPPLKGDNNRFDVCIVGAGYTGLSAALHLAGNGYKVCIVEAHRIGWGASGRNGGMVGTGQRQDQDYLEKNYGIAMARSLWQVAEDAKQLVGDLIEGHGIDCDPVAGIIEADHKPRYVAHSKAYALKLNELYNYPDIRPVDCEEIRGLIKTNAYFGGTMDKGAFHIQPLAYALGLARACEKAGVAIFEKSPVIHIQQGQSVRVETVAGSVTASHLIVACNGYLSELQKDVGARVMPINNFMIASEPLSEAKMQSVMISNGAVSDSRFVINYFRMVKSHRPGEGKRLVFGGGENYGYRFPADIKAFVCKPMLKIFPQMRDVRIDYGWGGTLALTMRRLPHFTRVSGNIISCSGYSGHGIAMATMAGKLAGEAIAGQAERFDLMAKLDVPRFPGGMGLRHPLLVLAMSWYALRDRL